MCGGRWKVEGDSKVVIRWGGGNGQCSWRLSSYLYEIKDLVASLAISLVHIPRCQNSLADKLANKGVISQFVVYDNVISKDC